MEYESVETVHEDGYLDDVFCHALTSWQLAMHILRVILPTSSQGRDPPMIGYLAVNP
jgi:hypothetical protein